MGLVSSRPLAHRVLYLRDVTPEAAPICISGRTSYLRVRLAFHPYPQLIRQFCNTERFGPSRRVSFASAWPWVAHTVSGPIHATLTQWISQPPQRFDPVLRPRLAPETSNLHAAHWRLLPPKVVFALFRLAFATAPVLSTLTWLRILTRRLILR